MKVRTRWAPSPTGYAHLGFISRILINYVLARKFDGQFIWRNEDTDMERFVPDSLQFNMHWTREFGLDWDEGPGPDEVADSEFKPEPAALKGGPFAPYTQSIRAGLGIYKEASEKLIANGYAYRCFCTKERLAELRKIQETAKIQTRYDGHCRNLSADEIAANIANNVPHTIRIKIPRGRKIEFDDAITHNHIVWDSNEVDDAIIVKSNGVPTYHLAAMYDDILMETTHIFRGSEWLASTPIHILVFEGLGVDASQRPQIGHFTVILDPNNPGKKMSKRNSSFRANGLIQKGYLAEAILNYLMLLGWAPKDNREIFTLPEFIEAFDLNGMQKANPTWDQKKMDWFNGVYLRQLTADQYLERFLSWISKYLLTATGEELTNNFLIDGFSEDKMNQLLKLARELLEVDRAKLQSMTALVQERAINFWDTLQQVEFFYTRPTNIDWNIKQLSKVQDKIALLKNDIVAFLSSLDADASKWQHTDWEAGMRQIGDKHEVKHGDVFMVLRVAVVGAPFSPPLFESLPILGKDEVLARLQA